MNRSACLQQTQVQAGSAREERLRPGNGRFRNPAACASFLAIALDVIRERLPGRRRYDLIRVALGTLRSRVADFRL